GGELADRLWDAPRRKGLHPDRHRRGHGGAGGARVGDWHRGDLRRWRRPLWFGKASGGGHWGGGRGRSAAAHFPRQAWFYASKRDARIGTSMIHRRPHQLYRVPVRPCDLPRFFRAVYSWEMDLG